MIQKSIIELVHKLGKPYAAADLPEEISFGEPGKCFDMCIIRALHHPEFRYVEGLAKIQGEWYLHAWLTDGEHAFDPTWALLDEEADTISKPPAEYLGIEMPTKRVAEFMQATTYQGVLGNSWRDPVRANRCIHGDIKVLP